MQAVEDYARNHFATEAVVISAQIESELVDLTRSGSGGISARSRGDGSGVGALIRAVYHLLGLRTYLTTGEKETRAWTIHEGDKAPAAAGVIHSDFERGFIAAETVHFDDLVTLGSFAKAREAGKLRIEGKEYVVKDGDVVEFGSTSDQEENGRFWKARNLEKKAGSIGNVGKKRIWRAPALC